MHRSPAKPSDEVLRPLVLAPDSGPSVAVHEIVACWRGHRDRLADALDSLPAAAWSHPSRCSAWTVADVVAHLADGARRAIPSFDPSGSDRTTFRDLDPRTTPAEWIAGGDRSPLRLIDDYRTSTDELLAAVESAASGRCAFTVWAPYRVRVPWQLFGVHVLFDHWLHERDVLLPLGMPHRPTAQETGLVAAYAAMVAIIVAGRLGATKQVHLHLEGLGEGCLTLDPRRRSVELAGPGCRRVVDGRADAASLADGLTGRTPRLGDVLTAPGDVVQMLAVVADWFRSGP